MSQSTSHPSSSCGSSPDPLPYNQPASSRDVPGTTTPHAPHISHQACLNQHSEAGLATGSTSSVLPQAPNLSLGQKRVAEDLDDRDTKRIKMDPEDPILPIFEHVFSVLPETMLTDAAEDPDVWQFISEIENVMDPSLPPCESLTDAAEDPDFCNYPIRTLLIGSWLNSSRWNALDQPL
ncbi:hypothetical protein CY34DRAFT_401846 [Suillus luteus UH-Slu-Lm8-n1]|uniref:Uncharacterized protein n=1 Tax=Suillus luteus UH-Slu-Lm8-n1 TaxID=930992 RepID=A0A0D0A8U6_9AGAM|nr:hypothetical protein CY34DRAFT_401846 [Suillus luteus UH-Slu-Lm8-n1]